MPKLHIMVNRRLLKPWWNSYPLKKKELELRKKKQRNVLVREVKSVFQCWEVAKQCFSNKEMGMEFSSWMQESFLFIQKVMRFILVSHLLVLDYYAFGIARYLVLLCFSNANPV